MIGVSKVFVWWSQSRLSGKHVMIELIVLIAAVLQIIVLVRELLNKHEDE
jgi:hypothetical protein